MVKRNGNRFDALLDDVGGMRTDLAEMRTDLAEMRIDQAGMRTELTGMRIDQAGVRTELTEMRADQEDMRSIQNKTLVILERSLSVQTKILDAQDGLKTSIMSGVESALTKFVERIEPRLARTDDLDGRVRRLEGAVFPESAKD